MNPVIEVKNIGKKYNIIHEQGRYLALRDVLMNVLRSPFSILKSKVKRATGLEKKEEYWALKNINFTVNKGEVIGIIGRNGAGKSTLLKILSQITPPTTGEVRITGRVGSLLEVGTGFHPELTGRENIMLNGAILGMTKKEIIKKFDQIVEFAGIEKFLDTPVKYYSSGMYVRLAFSVAAHMEPDILIIDEVLAVGDTEFQKKCLGKMDEITKKEGRTILFVSHNMGAIEQLCNRCILLENSGIKLTGETQKVIDSYITNRRENTPADFSYRLNPNKDAGITKISILNKEQNLSSKIPLSEPFTIVIEYEFLRPINNALLIIIFYFRNEYLFLSAESDETMKLKDYLPGKYITKVSIPAHLFNVGHYTFEVAIHRPYEIDFDRKTNIDLEILDINDPKSVIFRGNKFGPLSVILSYDTGYLGLTK
jgi:lipopolysaccharide transport system ATP-binding protein